MGFTRRCLNKEASVDRRVHLLLDEGSFRVLLMFASGEAVNAANSLHNLGQVHDLLKPKVKFRGCFQTNWRAFSTRVCGTDQSAVPVLQEQSEEEAGLGEDAAALVSHFIAGLLSVPLQQVQQNFHRVFHRVHRLSGLVVLLRGNRMES